MRSDKGSYLLATLILFTALPLLSLKLFHFRVEEVGVEGISLHHHPEIQKRLESLKGLPLFSIDRDTVDKCMGHKWMKCLGVKKVLPDRIHVTLQARKALVSVGDTWYDNEGCPVLTQLSPAPPLRMIGRASENQVKDLSRLARMAPDFISIFPTLKVENPEHWIMYTPGQAEVHLNPVKIQECLTRWSMTDHRLDLSREGTVIDLRYEGRVIIKEKGGDRGNTAGGN